MKKTIMALAFFTSLFVKAQSFELITGRDTINMIDALGKKQGKWVLLGHTNPKAGFMPYQKMEEGIYKDNRKTGIWIQYYTNGNVKNKITFADGRPTGPSSMYYETGNLKEEGTWINNRWVGKYKFINENGDITEMVFDDKGKETEKKIIPAKKNVPSKKK